MSTPVRSILRETSALLPAVRNGLQAVKGVDQDYIALDIRTLFADSMDLDSALQAGHDQDNRWDYLLGHTSTKLVIGLEPHSASNKEIPTVIKKRRAARIQLREHLRDGKHVAAWLWVASGRVDFQPLDKARLRLDQDGIAFVGKQLVKKRLEELLPAAKTARGGA